MKKLICILVFSLSGLLYAQQNDLQQRTLDLFLAGNWKDLTEISEEISKAQFNTYEPEYRLAVAYYNLGNYFDSAKHFEHIVSHYGIKNDAVLEYLYYSYLFSGRPQDAILVSKDFPFHLQAITDAKSFKFIDIINVEGGVKLSDSKASGIENLNYLNTGIEQQLGTRIRLQHAYTNISQDYIDFNYKQNEYYGAIRFQISKGLTLIPAYHFANTVQQERTSSGSGNPMFFPDRSGSHAITNKANTHIAQLAFKKQWNRFSISPNVVYITTDNSDKENSTVLQYGLHAGVSVKATKDRLWLGTGVDLVNNDFGRTSVWIAKIYYAFGTKAYLYLRYLNAGTSEFVQEDAMYYFNAISVMESNLSSTFGYRFSPKFECYVNYQRESASDYDYNIDFTYNTFITGLKIQL